MSGFSICLVDYTGDEEKDVLATIKFSGAKVETKPSSKTSHLICKVSHSEKYRRARNLGILTVSWGWLEECILTGKFQKETPFLIGDRSWEDSNRQELRNYSEEEGEENDNHFPLKQQTEDRRRRRKRTGRVEEEQANGNRTSINSVHKSFYAPESSELNVLYGVTVFITKSVPSSSSNGLQADVRSLGGEYVLTFNSTVTHIVHQGRVENTKVGELS
jgi:hypothetical protein